MPNKVVGARSLSEFPLLKTYRYKSTSLGNLPRTWLHGGSWDSKVSFKIDLLQTIINVIMMKRNLGPVVQSPIKLIAD